MVTKLDRISRSVVDFLLLIEELHRHGVEVVSLRENFDFTTPTGRMFVSLMVLLAQFERETTSARGKDKVEWRAEKGLPLGRPALGYVMKDKMYEIDEPFAAHVRTADEIYLERESADQVVLEFRKRGYRTPGGSFYAKPVICRMLRNEVYAGKKEYEGKIRDGLWKAIRTWETHLRIQKLMDRNRERNRSSKRQPDDYVYLLQGLLRCGKCAHKMSPKPGTGRNGLYYPYYSCGGAEKSVGGACVRQYVPAEALDQAVLAFLKELRLKPERLQAFAAKAQEFQSGTLGKLQEDLERTRERLGSVRSKLSRLADAIADGGKDVMTSLREKLKSLEAEREELEALESRCKADLETEQSQVVVVQDQVQALDRFQSLVEKSAKHPERIKMLIPRFVDYVVWHSDSKGEGRLEVALFPDPVALAQEIQVGGDPHPPVRCFVGGSQMVGAKGLEPLTSWVWIRIGNRRDTRPNAVALVRRGKQNPGLLTLQGFSRFRKEMGDKPRVGGLPFPFSFRAPSLTRPGDLASSWQVSNRPQRGDLDGASVESTRSTSPPFCGPRAASRLAPRQMDSAPS